MRSHEVGARQRIQALAAQLVHPKRERRVARRRAAVAFAFAILALQPVLAARIAAAADDAEWTAIEIAGQTVAPGETARIFVNAAGVASGASRMLDTLLMVTRGVRPGPTLCLVGGIHGDELNGVEIIRRVLSQIDAHELVGTLVAVPIVNVFGFLQQLRYLPDRRDLNRSFPGSRTGSLASRLAHLIMTEVVSACTHGIDLHTGSHHRTNLPQIRADLHDEATRELAMAFGAPVLIHAKTPDGSLRGAAAKIGKPVLLFEGGEALRFDEASIVTGVAGVLRSMSALGMIEAREDEAFPPPITVSRTRWLRARRGGILRMVSTLGDRVAKGQVLADIGDAFGRDAVNVKAPCAGVVIGLSQNPLVNQGDAVVHLGLFPPHDGEEAALSRPSSPAESER